MEQDPLVCVAEVEQLAYFLGGEAIDVAQGNDLALCRWQLGHCGADVRVQLVGKHLLADELHAHVRAAVAQLPPAQREVVTLRDIDGLGADEVCQVLDLTDANQRVLLHRGRSKVRAALEAYVAAHTTSA